MGHECTKFISRLAEMMASKQDKPYRQYSEVITWMRHKNFYILCKDWKPHSFDIINKNTTSWTYKFLLKVSSFRSFKFVLLIKPYVYTNTQEMLNVTRKKIDIAPILKFLKVIVVLLVKKDLIGVEWYFEMTEKCFCDVLSIWWLSCFSLIRRPILLMYRSAK